MMVIAFITLQSSLVPLIEGLVLHKIYRIGRKFSEGMSFSPIWAILLNVQHEWSRQCLTCPFMLKRWDKQETQERMLHFNAF